MTDSDLTKYDWQRQLGDGDSGDRSGLLYRLHIPIRNITQTLMLIPNPDPVATSTFPWDRGSCSCRRRWNVQVQACKLLSMHEPRSQGGPRTSRGNAHERYRQTTDGRTTTYSERERFWYQSKARMQLPISD